MTSPGGVSAAVRTLYLDTVTAEVVGALEKAGVRSILLKGPCMAAAFYEVAEHRPYSDVDLLVQAGAVSTAENVLVALGFTVVVRRESLIDPNPMAVTWVRGREMTAAVDLHTSFHGVRYPAGLWKALEQEVRELRVGGRVVSGLSVVGAAAIATLHASALLPDDDRPVEDLRRAVARLTPAEWEHVAHVLGMADALPIATASLSLHGFPAVAALVGGDSPASKTTMLAASSLRSSAHVKVLHQTTSWRNKVQAAVRILWPSRDYMDYRAVRAGEEAERLARSRLKRLAVGTANAPRDVLQVLRSRRRAPDTTPPDSPDMRRPRGKAHRGA